MDWVIGGFRIQIDLGALVQWTGNHNMLQDIVQVVKAVCYWKWFCDGFIQKSLENSLQEKTPEPWYYL